MPEPLNQELSVFLRCARDELLSNLAPEKDPIKPHRARRVAAALSQMIARSEILAEVDAELVPRTCALLDEAARMLKRLRVQIPDAGSEDPLERLTTSMRHLSALVAEANAQSEVAAECLRLARGIRDLDAARHRATQAALRRLEDSDRAKLAARKSELAALTQADVTQFLRRAFPQNPDVAVQNFAQPKGVYSKENYRFDIVGLTPEPLPAILRRDRNFEIVPTSAAREFDLLKQLHGRGLPVARCLAVQYDDTPPLSRPCLLMERAPGATPAQFDPKSTSRLNAAALNRDTILQLAAPLARLHTTETRGLAFPVENDAPTCRGRFLKILDHYCDQLHRVAREPFPILEASFAWLYANSHLIEDVTTLVHADYDLRNVLFDNGRLTTVLDFELSHLGHPAEDLGYLRKDIEAHVPWVDFMAAYTAAGGRNVADELVRYFVIWAYAFHGTCNVTAFSGYRSGVHADVFLGTLCFVEFKHIQRRLVELLPGEDQ